MAESVRKIPECFVFCTTYCWSQLSTSLLKKVGENTICNLANLLSLCKTKMVC